MVQRVAEPGGPGNNELTRCDLPVEFAQPPSGGTSGTHDESYIAVE